MKDYFKKTWCMYVVVFCLCFMLFLYEPVQMYLSNVSDFYFGLSVVFKMSFLLFLIFFVILVALFNLLFFKFKKVYNVALIIISIVLICSYIQGNFLAGSLPVLDGELIEWSNYTKESIVSIVLWLVVIGLTVFAIKKFSMKKVVKYTGYAGLVIIFMLSTSFITGLLTSRESVEKSFSPYVTYDNFNKYSSDKNFIIFVLDSIDSNEFMVRLNKDNSFKNILNDFSYYKDAMCGHIYTDESMPLILTGKYFENEAPIAEWSTEAYKDSALFSLMEKNDYELNVYESGMAYYDPSATRITNIHKNDYESDISKVKFWKQEAKYILFKYLPTFLKRYSKINEMHFEEQYISSNEEKNDNTYNWSNYEMLKRVRDSKVYIANNKVFKSIHVKGAHVPYTYNKEYVYTRYTTYDDEIDASLTLIKEYLDMLKTNKVYDNSVIIIMADHGYGIKANNFQRQNPILFVKGIGETHKNIVISEKPVHYTDLQDLYKDLVQDKKSSEVFKDVPDQRVRRFLSYSFENKDVMIEYETKGKALENAYKTGKEYRKNW